MAKARRSKVKPISANAERQRRRRERAAAGLVRIDLWFDEVKLADLLVESGFLDPNLADNSTAINAATASLINALAVAEIHKMRNA